MVPLDPVPDASTSSIKGPICPKSDKHHVRAAVISLLLYTGFRPRRQNATQQLPAASVSLSQDKVAREVEVFGVGIQLALATRPRRKVREDLEFVGHPPVRVLGVGAEQVPHDVVVGVADFNQLEPMNLVSKDRRGFKSKTEWSWG